MGLIAVQDRRDAGAVQAIFLLRSSPEDDAEVRSAWSVRPSGGTDAESLSQCLGRRSSAWARRECRLSV